MADQASRQSRLTAAALLLATRRTRLGLSAELDAGVHQTIGGVLSAKASSSARGRASVLSAVIVASAALAVGFNRAILAGRIGARTAGLKRLDLEFVGWDIGPLSALTAGGEEDAARSLIAGQSLANAWQGAAAVATTNLRAGESGVARSLGAARTKVLASIDRTAETETAQAFNAQRLESAREMASRGPKMGRRWESMLDACESCWPHDGETVGIDEDYSGGDEPGWMHPRCRCFESFVLLD